MRPLIMALSLWAVVAGYVFGEAAISAEDDVQKQLDSFFQSHFLAAEGDHFSYRVFKFSQSTVQKLYQYKGLEAHLVPSAISRLDALNGLEWKGYIELKAKAYRYIDWDKDPTAGVWNPWEEFPVERYKLYKVNNEWHVDASKGSNITDQAPDVNTVKDVIRRPAKAALSSVYYPSLALNWEKIDDAKNIFRARVPGGWLVTSAGSITFVPDEQSKWEP